MVEAAGGEDANITISNIVCGSISFDTAIEVNTAKSVDDFKQGLKEEAKKPLSIQNVQVQPEELQAAVETVEEVKPEPEVSKGGLTGGAIAGIIIGSILLLLLIVIVVLMLNKGQRKSATISSTSRVKLSEVNDGH